MNGMSDGVGSRQNGLSLTELLVVLTITAIGLTFAGLAFTSYFDRVSAERAAQVFAQDLTLARDWAVRAGGAPQAGIVVLRLALDALADHYENARKTRRSAVDVGEVPAVEQ